MKRKRKKNRWKDDRFLSRGRKRKKEVGERKKEERERKKERKSREQKID